MELEEMKMLWGEMSAAIEKQKKSTDTLIIKMTQVNYRHRISKIAVPEKISAVVCAAIIIFIIVNFQKLGTWYLQLFAVLTVVILGALSFLSLRAIHKMSSINISANNYKQTLAEYSKGRLQFMFVQKLSFYLTAILLVVSLPVMVQLIAEKNPFKVTRLWMFYAVSFPFFTIFARWVYKYYSKTTRQIEGLLKDLEE